MENPEWAKIALESLTERDKQVLKLGTYLLIPSVLFTIAFAIAVATQLLGQNPLFFRISGWLGGATLFINGVRVTMEGILNMDGIIGRLMRPDMPRRIRSRTAKIFQGVFISLLGAGILLYMVIQTIS